MHDAAQRQERIKVIVSLTDQPASEIARQEQAFHLPAVNQLSDEIKLLTQPFNFNDVIPAPIRQQARALRLQQEGQLEDMRRAIYDRIEPRVRGQQDQVSEFVENDLNGAVHARILLINALGVEIPSAVLDRLSQHPDVRLITLNHEGQPELNVSHKAIEANYVWNKGFNGDGVTDVAVVDSGIFMQHNAFGGQDNHRGPDRNFMIGQLPTQILDNYGHGTAVAGIIASNTMAQAPGISHGMDKLISARVQDINSGPDKMKVMQAVEWAVNGLDNGAPTNPPNNELAEIVNISLGWKHMDTPLNPPPSYTPIAQFFDAVVDDLLVAVTKSAGNKEGGLKRITVPADAYNILVVGNINDGLTPDRGNDHIWKGNLPNDFEGSAEGPTRDGRKKPDLCAPGTKIRTTLTNGGYGQNLAITGDEITGTSFAAPHVAGAVALLMDAWIPNPLLIKTLLINTADDQIAADDDEGWDKYHGWGYISLKRAYDSS